MGLISMRPYQPLTVLNVPVNYNAGSVFMSHVGISNNTLNSQTIIFDNANNIYYSDVEWAGQNNGTAYIYKITPSGTLTTFASVSTQAGRAGALEIDSSGNIYWAIANYRNTPGGTNFITSYVYKITPSGTLTTFASAATIGAAGTELRFDSTGNLYWAVINYTDGIGISGFNRASYVYKITPAGTLTTFATIGTVGGVCTAMRFDSTGNLYWAAMNHTIDGTTWNLTSYLYKITPSGTLTTVSSQPTFGATGTDIVIDSSDTVYWSVQNSWDGTTTNLTSYIYKVTSSGTVSLFASQATSNIQGCSMLIDTYGDIYWSMAQAGATAYIYRITVGGTITVLESVSDIFGPNYYANSEIRFDSSNNLYWLLGTNANPEATIIQKYTRI